MPREDVQVFVDGGVGRLRLNRPEALHALTLEMCRKMTAALLAWRDDPAVRLVMIDHAEGRGFCAGGDVRSLYDSVQAGDGEALRFFYEEYRLDHLLFAYPKPTVAVMDGVVMGGGCGVAMPCRYRIATERTALAMPETAIGLFPDVGGGWFLSRLPSCAGAWMALTGARVRAADCLLLGLATDYVAAADLERLKAQIIAEPEAVETRLAELDADAGQPEFATVEDRVRRAFGADTVEEILERLSDEGEWGEAQAKAMAGRSPLLMKVALRQLQEGARKAGFADEMAMEFRMVSRVIMSPDFTEGVRAVIVDKDNAPRWRPAALAQVTPQMVEAVFAPLPAGQEWTPLPQLQGDRT